MPGYNITKKSEKLNNLSIKPDRTLAGQIGEVITDDGVDRLEVSGEYQIEIANQGIAPVFMPSVTIQELEMLGVVAIEGKTKRASTLSGGDSTTITFTFNVTSDNNVFVSTMKSLCNQGGASTVDSTVNGQVSAIILGNSIDSSTALEVDGVSCNLPDQGTGGGGDQPGQQPPGEEPPDDGGGSTQSSVEIEVLERAGTDGQVEMQANVVNNYGGVTQLQWDLGDGTSASNTDTITHTYDESGTYEVFCRLVDGLTGEVVAQDRVTLVVELSGSVGEGEIDGPTIVVVDEENTWRFTGDPGNDNHFSWQMGDDTDYDGIGMTEVSHTYDFQGPKTIDLLITSGGIFGGQGGATLHEEEFQIEVEDPATGGLSQGLPNMSEVAERKPEEF